MKNILPDSQSACNSTGCSICELRILLALIYLSDIRRELMNLKDLSALCKHVSSAEITTSVIIDHLRHSA